jgi:hypothetical protein
MERHPDGVFPCEMDYRERDLVDVTALADGSLPERRRAQVERRVAGSPELSAMLERQRRALHAVRAAAVPAPPSLRARVGAAAAPRRRPVVAALGLAGAAAAALVALLVLPGSAPEAPSVAQAASLAARGPTGGPPPRYDDAPLLDRQIGGIRFPRWEERFGWRASGVRADRLGGRAATTVYYRSEGGRLGYTIVDGAPLAAPDGRRTVRDGVEFRSLRSGGRTVVTWRQKGHTCVLSGADVGSRVMVQLAAWRARY